MYLYHDREEAGIELAELLTYEGIQDPLMLALPKGGVPVASVIAHELGIPFEVLVTREVSYPGHGEFGIGAMSEDERAFIIDDINFADPRILEAINEERHELRRRMALYRQGHRLPNVTGRNIILVDDGFTDGVSALAAAKFLKTKGAEKVVLAVPVAPETEGEHVKKYIDKIICPHRLSDFASVGQWFEDFHEVTDHEVLELLSRD